MIQASQQNGMRKLKNLNTHTNTAAQPKTMNWQRGKRIYYEILMKKHFFFLRAYWVEELSYRSEIFMHIRSTFRLFCSVHEFTNQLQLLTRKNRDSRKEFLKRAVFFVSLGDVSLPTHINVYLSFASLGVVNDLVVWLLFIMFFGQKKQRARSRKIQRAILFASFLREAKHKKLKTLQLQLIPRSKILWKHLFHIPDKCEDQEKKREKNID